MSQRILSVFLATALSGTIPAGAGAEGMPSPVPAVVTHAIPAPRLATVFELTLRIPEGRGIARLLIDAGLASEDAAAAARLAAGHLGDGVGGCDAKVEISHAVGTPGLRLERLVLTSSQGTTIIERRADQLQLTSAVAHAGVAFI